MWTGESGYFLIRWLHKIVASIYLANLYMAADRREVASVLLGLISNLLACMLLNVAPLNAEISYLTNKEASAVYYTVIKHDGHLRTREKCRKHEP